MRLWCFEIQESGTRPELFVGFFVFWLQAVFFIFCSQLLIFYRQGTHGSVEFFLMLFVFENQLLS